MLLFEKKPDKIFTKILHSALDIAVDYIKTGGDEYYKETFPNASKNFSKILALEALKALREFSEDSDLWTMTDYHLVLLYDALKHYCGIMEHCAINSGEALLSVEDYTVLDINFEDLISCYFRDTDFLFPKEFFLDIPEEMREHFGYSEQTFAIVNGMIPHQEELIFQCCKQGEFIPEYPMPSTFRKESRVYPDVSNAEYYS